MRVDGPSQQVTPDVRQREVQATRDITKTNAPGAVDTFDDSGIERTDGGKPAAKKGFFARFFEAIGNFFAKIWSFLTGKGGNSEEPSSSQPATSTVSKNARRAISPAESLRPETTTSATRRPEGEGRVGTRVSTSAGFPPNLSRFSNQGVDTRLPTDDPNIHHYKSASVAWGTERTVAMLEAVATEYRAQTGYALRVGDISKRGGGQLGRHESHKYGRNIDLDLAFNDGRTTTEPSRGSTNATWKSPAYDRDATRKLIQLIKQCNPNAEILFNDPVLVAEGLVTKYAHHDNHLHVQGLRS